MQVNIGGTFSLNKNKIKEQAEEPRAYENLVTTGYPLNSIWGLKSDGLLTQQDIDNMNLPETDPNYVPKHTFTTVHPGDIKYVDVNGDGKIDKNDYTKIGYSTVCLKSIIHFIWAQSIRDLDLMPCSGRRPLFCSVEYLWLLLGIDQ